MIIRDGLGCEPVVGAENRTRCTVRGGKRRATKWRYRVSCFTRLSLWPWESRQRLFLKSWEAALHIPFTGKNNRIITQSADTGSVISYLKQKDTTLCPPKSKLWKETGPFSNQNSGPVYRSVATYTRMEYRTHRTLKYRTGCGGQLG